jgi:hypothetical protein
VAGQEGRRWPAAPLCWGAKLEYASLPTADVGQQEFPTTSHVSETSIWQLHVTVVPQAVRCAGSSRGAGATAGGWVDALLWMDLTWRLDTMRSSNAGAALC